METSPPFIEAVFLILQGLFALVMFFFGLTLKAMREDIRESSRSIVALATMVANKETEAVEKFVTKDDWNATRERIHDLTETVVVLKTKADFATRGGDD